MSVAKQQEKSTQTEAKQVFEVGGARHKKQKRSRIANMIIYLWLSTDHMVKQQCNKHIDKGIDEKNWI